MRHLRDLSLPLLLSLFACGITQAGQEVVRDGPIGEAVAAQLRDGTTVPLVVRVLEKPVQARRSEATPRDVAEVKRMAREAATAHALPVEYFLRLIKQESGFNHRAVSRAGAQGIAQFMPGTAANRGLKDPFDPAEALPKSAAFLSELTRQFGNIGLAAAAYNGGPTRVANWLAGRGGLPLETRSYVLAITGRTAEEWAPAGATLLKGDVRSPSLRMETAKRALAYRPKNWERDLLDSLTKAPSSDSAGKLPAAPKPVDLISAVRADVRSRKRVTRVSATVAERALCPSCVIQNSY